MAVTRYAASHPDRLTLGGIHPEHLSTLARLDGWSLSDALQVAGAVRYLQAVPAAVSVDTEAGFTVTREAAR